MSFVHPWMLLLIPIYLIVEWIRYYRFRSNAASLPTAPFVRIRQTWRTQVLKILRFVPPAVAVLLLFGIASPQTTNRTEQVLPSGIQIMVVLDVSGSMAAEDFKPVNRLEGAKDVLRDFIRGRRSDRIGLVVFAGRSITRSPLTLQHDVLLRTLTTIKMGDLPEGTAIGMAIMTGINRLLVTDRDDKKGDRIMILITDGRNNGEIHPLTGVEEAIKHRIKIYTIGVGGFGSAPFPVFTAEGKKTYRYENADLDESLLKQVASRTGGQYFGASDPESLSLLFRQIDRLEKSEPQLLETLTVQSQAHVLTVPMLFLAICYIVLTMIIVRIP